MSRMSRKAKIRRIKKRQAELRSRNWDIVGLINRNGAGFHTSKADYRNSKAPTIEQFDS